MLKEILEKLNESPHTILTDMSSGMSNSLFSVVGMSVNKKDGSYDDVVKKEWDIHVKSDKFNKLEQVTFDYLTGREVSIGIDIFHTNTNDSEGWYKGDKFKEAFIYLNYKGKIKSKKVKITEKILGTSSKLGNKKKFTNLTIDLVNAFLKDGGKLDKEFSNNFKIMIGEKEYDNSPWMTGGHGSFKPTANPSQDAFPNTGAYFHNI